MRGMSSIRVYALLAGALVFVPAVLATFGQTAGSRKPPKAVRAAEGAAKRCALLVVPRDQAARAEPDAPRRATTRAVRRAARNRRSLENSSGNCADPPWSWRSDGEIGDHDPLAAQERAPSRWCSRMAAAAWNFKADCDLRRIGRATSNACFTKRSNTRIAQAGSQVLDSQNSQRITSARALIARWRRCAEILAGEIGDDRVRFPDHHWPSSSSAGAF